MLDVAGAVGAAAAGVVGHGALGRGLDAVTPLAFHIVAGDVHRVRMKTIILY